YLEEQPNEDSAMARLFGMAEGYRRHFKGILEHRIAQIAGIDPTLKRYLERCVGDLPDHPDVFMTNVRGIVDRAFEFIWKTELGTRLMPVSCRRQLVDLSDDVATK